MIDAVLRHRTDRLALVAPAQHVRLSYVMLADRVEELAERLQALAGPRRVVFLAPGPDVESVLLYLACLRARMPLCLAEPQPEPLARLAAAYQPSLVLAPREVTMPNGWSPADPVIPGHVAALADRPKDVDLHPDLALLLTTSGSTGSPKLVRLAERNLAANAAAIAEYLGLGEDERAIQSLPMYYSYGLSVLNSHLLAGGTVVLTPHSFLRPEFWGVADSERATSFAGVPYMYETLLRLRFDPARHPTVRTFTQAGGALRRELIVDFHARAAAAAGARMFVMYGQTEATARISYVPPQRLPEKAGTIGLAIPGGRLRLEPLERGDATGSELVYEGANVMLGYAESPADLALGDVQGGTLRTGDLGAMDSDGFFSVVGRLKRFTKLFGRRVSLEDVEREVESMFPVRVIATGAGECLVVCATEAPEVRDDALLAHIARFLGVPPTAILVRRLPELPLTSTGKKDYKALETAR